MSFALEGFDGNVATYSYYASGPHVGMLEQVSYVGATGSGKADQTVSYTYDALGRQSTVTDASGTTTDHYDSQGNLNEQDTPEGTIHYVYNPATNRHVETYTDNTDTQYGYDKIGQLTTVTVNKLNGATLTTPLATSYTYDSIGDKLTETLPDGIVTSYTYDALNRLTGVVEKKNTTTLFSQQYILKEDGSRASVDESQLQSDGSTITSQTAWTYDGDGRLTDETYASSVTSNNYEDAFAYDLNSNRVTQTHTGSGGNETITSTYNSDDQLTTAVSNVNGETDYSYDDNGSQITVTHGGQTDTYNYDVRNKLASVTTAGATTSYLYDLSGNRVQEVTGGVTTVYLIDNANPTNSSQPIEEKATATASPRITYMIGDRVLGQASGTGTVNYLLTDGQGSTRILASAEGAVSDDASYTAFGGAIAFNPSIFATEFQFAGDGMYDLASGLTFHSIGRPSVNQQDRFLQRDDPGYDENSDPITHNLYLLDNADTLRYRDPRGHDVEEVEVAMTIGEWLDATMARGVQIATRFARPLVGLLSSGSAWLVGQGQNALEFLRSQGYAAVSFLQTAFLHQEEILSEAEVESGPIWDSPAAARDYLNKLVTGGPSNPEGIQWHHLVNRAADFSQRLLNSAANLVPTPTPIHGEISGFLSSRPDWLSEAYPSVQRFVLTLNWSQQYEIGLKIWQSAMYGQLAQDGPQIVQQFMH